MSNHIPSSIIRKLKKDANQNEHLLANIELSFQQPYLILATFLHEFKLNTRPIRVLLLSKTDKGLLDYLKNSLHIETQLFYYNKRKPFAEPATFDLVVLNLSSFESKSKKALTFSSKRLADIEHSIAIGGYLLLMESLSPISPVEENQIPPQWPLVFNQLQPIAIPSIQTFGSESSDGLKHQNNIKISVLKKADPARKI